MYFTQQNQLQHTGLAAQIVNDERLAMLTDTVKTSMKLTQAALLKRALNSVNASSLILLTHKSESLELHRIVLDSLLGNTEKSILLSYIDQNIEIIDEALCKKRIN
ncbi:hypothetical protein CXF83_12575 [Shewanella sp. Choline-02u-19]|uniref:hypothetical protein n=1 Tax=unclassified Shewanella TaxID=196818 RepID=UPI000C3337FC|nr:MULTISPECIES: hypothetical protein [unclassified Shewanella]PKG59136.1 hypothetical protein CXF82_00830 [Shewanella sp. GutDb-MelDb]PKG75337.1 hypothetical protein CXF86_08160 [Shewanella sp. GutCb]PKH57969.1 hypothetical protein CXF84_06695 [Shewanella sp. Bg11-22]PKI27482.1 hypothetical protein CXF83_12575 [Shewanella sp. Choline-02u-19]